MSQKKRILKSYDNAIFLADSPDEISAKVSRMITDPQRAYYDARPERVEEIMTEGSNRARRTARQTMEEVRAAVKI